VTWEWERSSAAAVWSTVVRHLTDRHAEFVRLAEESREERELMGRLRRRGDDRASQVQTVARCPA
jgi:hypothetical protein